MNKDLIYVVKDLPVAAYLKYMDIKLIAPYDKTRGAWLFDNASGRCEEYELAVRNDEAIISVAKYEATRKNILGMAHKIV